VTQANWGPIPSPTLVSIDQVISDFDGVTFHISTPETKSKILISISVKCYPDLLKNGAQRVLEREYGELITETEAGYDFSLMVDLANLPAGQGFPPPPSHSL
jgi:actin related protein 2/3 complex subunit 2